MICDLLSRRVCNVIPGIAIADLFFTFISTLMCSFKGVRRRKKADTKDRRTNMAHSSVNAPPKKDGAGGAYTWGGATDVTDYAPVGVDTSAVGVHTTYVAQSMSGVPMQTVEYRHSATDFPVLGTPAQRPSVVNWAPQAQPIVVHQAVPVATTSGSVVLAGHEPRPGVTFDQSHPRNQFAVKPHTAPATTLVTSAPAIDWSSPGMAQVNTALVVAGSPSHVSPVNPPRPVQQIPLSVMQAQVRNQVNYAPTVSKSYMANPRPIVQPGRR